MLHSDFNFKSWFEQINIKNKKKFKDFQHPKNISKLESSIAAELSIGYILPTIEKSDI